MIRRQADATTALSRKPSPDDRLGQSRSGAWLPEPRQTANQRLARKLMFTGGGQLRGYGSDPSTFGLVSREAQGGSAEDAQLHAHGSGVGHCSRRLQWPPLTRIDTCRGRSIARTRGSSAALHARLPRSPRALEPPQPADFPPANFCHKINPTSTATASTDIMSAASSRNATTMPLTIRKTPMTDIRGLP
ncbi:hypothetical protein ThimaDRAFT_0796 [Thiocapsa marina 5811]|uniref:Uncharacterized protein n=1 Tax=Thiocapsa marina 5811 TaxID=768671 RepID=F9U794_9GAMM|nr:hypothetical protein ThimaDRAFT_0796 [Thiocapsa marina 5811]